MGEIPRPDLTVRAHDEHVAGNGIDPNEVIEKYGADTRAFP